MNQSKEVPKLMDAGRTWLCMVLGCALLAVSWLAVTARGIWLARKGDIARHRQWMIRSFALTFAAVTLRLQLPVLFLLGMNYETASNVIGWTCWVPNLIVAEWLIRGGFGLRRGVPTVA